MITSLQNHLAPVEKPQPGATTTRRPVLTPTATQTDFQKLFQPALGSAKTSATGASGGASSSTSPQPAATAGTPASTPIPVPPITDPMNQSQVEAHMNGWLENVTQQANNQKEQIYQQAMSDWQINSQRAQDLGLPAPPQPAAPKLDLVQPMPTGFWFT